MPTTLTGLLLFVVILLPGFAYLVGKERHGTERRLSPFRETVAIISASVASELVILLIFAGVRMLWPSETPNVGALLGQGALYLHGNRTHHGHYQIFAVSGGRAAGLGYGAWHTRPRSLACDELANGLLGPYPHESTVSAWWMLFERWRKAREYGVTCILDDGSSIVDSSDHSISRRTTHLTETLYYGVLSTTLRRAKRTKCRTLCGPCALLPAESSRCS